MPFGRGRVAIVSDPDQLRNDVLRECTWNAGVTAIRMLEWVDPARTRRLVFDEYHQGYGPHASPRTFGHGGSQCCSAFADPEHGLAVAIVWNGRPGEQRHDRRLRETLTALYQDLGLAG